MYVIHTHTHTHTHTKNAAMTGGLVTNIVHDLPRQVASAVDEKPPELAPCIHIFIYVRTFIYIYIYMYMYYIYIYI